MAYPENWDEIADQCRAHLEASSGRPVFENAFAAALKNVELLRKEFEFETIHPYRSLGTVVLNPFPDKPAIDIYSDSLDAMCHVCLYDGQRVLEETTVAQEQLVSTVYEYLEKLKTL